MSVGIVCDRLISIRFYGLYSLTGFGISIVGFLALWFSLQTYECMQYVLAINPDSSNRQ
jgi:hypothetical protein